jgi:hypothetical protein
MNDGLSMPALDEEEDGCDDRYCSAEREGDRVPEETVRQALDYLELHAR